MVQRKERLFIPKQEFLTIKIDYISIVFDTATAEEVIRRVLELPVDIFDIQSAKVQHKSYQSVYAIGSIKVFGNAKKNEDNPFGLGSYLVLSGMGCDEIFRILDMHGQSFGDLFKRCERWFCDKFHFTRLDIAIDDRNEVPYFTIKQLKRKCEREEYIANSNTHRFNESKYQEYSTAKTVYIGAGKSAMSYRFYDKDKEVSMKQDKTLDDIGSWKRTEMQLRDEKAHIFTMMFKDNPFDLGKLAFDLLAGNLRFLVPNKNESNKSRWKTCRFWERFLGAVEPLKLRAETSHNTLLETQHWLKEGGVLSAVKAFHFLEVNHALGDLERVEDMLKQVRYSPKLGNKLTGHLCKIHREELIPYVQYDTKKG